MRMCKLTRLMALAGAMVLAQTSFALLLDSQVRITRVAGSDTLTISYSNQSVALIELRVNGRIYTTRAVDANVRTGEATFDIDRNILEDGVNEIRALLYDGTGKLVGEKDTEIQWVRTGDSLIRILRPQGGETVQGPVEIRIEFTRPLDRPFVSFFINNEFQMIRNFPPYSFVWDTTRVTNGWHEFQAWAVDSANNTHKSETVRVFVNNPGGRTDRQDVSQASGLAGNSSDPTLGGQQNDLRGAAGTGSAANRQGAAQTPTVRPVDEPRASTSGSGSATASPAGTKAPAAQEGIATGPRTLTPTGERLIAGFDLNNEDQLVIFNPNQTMGEMGLLVLEFGTRIPNMGEFAILFNNAPVFFDVAPRVMNGIALAPFRHLFEHAGGEVGWDHSSKTVTAEGLGLNLMFQIGLREAQLNGSPIFMETVPFIERNRAMVPLSFIREALGVRVQVDPESGHVLITTDDED